MNGLKHFLGSRSFLWLVVICGFLIIGVWNTVNNRAAINRNEATLKEHQQIVEQQKQVLIHLCSTIHLLDSGYVQQMLIARESINDPATPPSVRERWRDRLRVYTAIHEELSNTRSCRQIE